MRGDKDLSWVVAVGAGKIKDVCKKYCGGRNDSIWQVTEYMWRVRVGDKDDSKTGNLDDWENTGTLNSNRKVQNG